MTKAIKIPHQTNQSIIANTTGVRPNQSKPYTESKMDENNESKSANELNPSW